MFHPPKLSVGDLVRVDFCGRTALITSNPVAVSMNGDIEYRVGLRWENGLLSPSYNTNYLELIRESR